MVSQKSMVSLAIDAAAAQDGGRDCRGRGQPQTVNESRGEEAVISGAAPTRRRDYG
jgi:hypothetical protein